MKLNRLFNEAKYDHGYGFEYWKHIDNKLSDLAELFINNEIKIDSMCSGHKMRFEDISGYIILVGYYMYLEDVFPVYIYQSYVSVDGDHTVFEMVQDTDWEDVYNKTYEFFKSRV